jgi:hypothetical protein
MKTLRTFIDQDQSVLITLDGINVSEKLDASTFRA